MLLVSKKTVFFCFFLALLIFMTDEYTDATWIAKLIENNYCIEYCFNMSPLT